MCWLPTLPTPPQPPCTPFCRIQAFQTVTQFCCSVRNTVRMGLAGLTTHTTPNAMPRLASESFSADTLTIPQLPQFCESIQDLLAGLCLLHCHASVTYDAYTLRPCVRSVCSCAQARGQLLHQLVAWLAWPAARLAARALSTHASTIRQGN